MSLFWLWMFWMFYFLRALKMIKDSFLVLALRVLVEKVISKKAGETSIKYFDWHLNMEVDWKGWWHCENINFCKCCNWMSCLCWSLWIITFTCVVLSVGYLSMCNSYHFCLFEHHLQQQKLKVIALAFDFVVLFALRRCFRNKQMGRFLNYFFLQKVLLHLCQKKLHNGFDFFSPCVRCAQFAVESKITTRRAT